jgi:hypothetical protein
MRIEASVAGARAHTAQDPSAPYDDNSAAATDAPVRAAGRRVAETRSCHGQGIRIVG